MSAKAPRIYDARMTLIGDLRTAEISDLRIKQVPLSTVTLTIPTEDMDAIGYRQFVELFDASGERIDIFRVNGIPKARYTQGGTVKLTCDQALCTLQDGLIAGYHQFGGVTQSLRGAVEAVLSYQGSEPLWVLDACEFDTHYEYGICDETPYTALMMLLEPLIDPIIVTDTSRRPWRLSILRMTDADASELRYSRNMDEITETVQGDAFATRLYPRGYGEGINQLTIRDVNSGVDYIEAPQAVRDLWGLVCRPYIDTTVTDAATLKAKAEAVLAVCQTPQISYEVKAVDLHHLTGEAMDRFHVGHMVRIIYHAYGIVVRTRVREICTPRPIAAPGEVKLTLASQPASVTTLIAELERKSRIAETYGQGSTFIYADSVEQNADADNPAESDIYIPENMVHVNAVMLKVTLSHFRADSRGAAGGGGTVTTTGAGGESTRTSSAGGGTTLTVDKRTVAEVKTSGSPMVEGAVQDKTGFALGYGGSPMSSTGAKKDMVTGAPMGEGGEAKVTTDEATGSTDSCGELTTGVSRDADGPKLDTASGGGGDTGEKAAFDTGVSRDAGGPKLDTAIGGGGNTGEKAAFDTGASRDASGPKSKTGSGGGGDTGEKAAFNTGRARTAAGVRSTTDSAVSGNTGNASPATGGSLASDGTARNSTGSGGGGNTGEKAEFNTGRARTAAGVRSTTDSAVSGNTGNASPATGGSLASDGTARNRTGSGGGGDTGEKAAFNTGASRDAGGAKTRTGSGGSGNTGNAGSSTSENGSHSHSGGSHKHSTNTHRHTYSGGTYTSYNGAGDTNTSTLTTNSGGKHSHTVNDHSHSISDHSHGMDHWHNVDAHSHSVSAHSHDMAHWHTTNAHSHSIGNHSHGMDHWHTVDAHSHSVSTHTHDMAHWHTVDAHSHSVPAHTHGMNHWHSVDAHSHSVPAHAHGMSHWHTLDGHSHGLGSHVHKMGHYHKIEEHSHDMTHRHEFNHYHQVNVALTIPGQQLTLDAHQHTVEIPAHDHSLTLADHAHGLVYGIFKGPTVTQFTVEVDGQTVPAQVFQRGEGDIAPYLSADANGRIRRGVFHTLRVRPVGTKGNEAGLCRIRASWSAQVFISSLTGRQY